jgi:hypothetical protein
VVNVIDREPGTSSENGEDFNRATSMQIQQLPDSPFVILSFLAAPAILTNASTLLALGTSNRLARAADRARAAAAGVVGSSTAADPLTRLQLEDFHNSTKRTQLLITALRRFYLSAGLFAAGTCVALVGAFADYFHVSILDTVTQLATVMTAAAGVWALVSGSAILVRETNLATRMLQAEHAAITTWRATHPTPPPPDFPSGV